MKGKLLSTAVAFAIVFVSMNTASAQTGSDQQDFHPDWAKLVKPNKTDRRPNTKVVADDEGNVYQFVKVTRGLTMGEANDVSFGSKQTVAVLIKYDKLGKVLWHRAIQGDIVTADALSIDNGKLYLGGSHSNNLKNPSAPNQTGLELIADGGDNPLVNNTLPTDKKFDDDVYIAVYDLEGNLQALRSIQSNLDAKGRIETVSDILHHNDKVYLVGKSICYTGFGANPSFDGLEVKVGKSNEFAFVFSLDEELKLEKIYSIAATDDSDISLSEIAASSERILLTGSTNALKPLKYNGDKMLEVKGTVLIYAELDLNTDQFKALRSLGKSGSWTMGYSMVVAKEGIFLGGKSGENVKLPILGGQESETLNGAFIAKWDIAQEAPEKIYQIGSNNEDNVVGAMAMAKNGKLLLAGDFYETFNAINPPTISFGETDSFIGLFDLKKGELEKLSCYGSTGLDEVQSLYFNGASDNFYFTGFYSGDAFSLYGLDNPENAGGRKFYYLACKHLEDENTTGLEGLEEEVQYVSLRGHQLTWLRDTAFIIYNLEGTVVHRGQAHQGERLNLNKGIFFIRLANGRVIKLLIP